MEKLNILLENCYGIKKLETSFDFSEEHSFLIYAPNGAMKTSLANTFSDLANNTPSKDRIFPSRIPKREIKKENGQDLMPSEVFVIDSYNDSFESKKVSTLLVNKSLKDKYDSIHEEIDKGKDKLTNELNKLSGLRSGVEDEISDAFTHKVEPFLVALESVKPRVMDKTEPSFSDIKYKEIFNDKVLDFLSKKDFKTKIQEYINKYNELIDASQYFKKGVFNHNNASTIAKNLVDNGFFAAEHSVFLHCNGATDKQIDSQEELEKVIEEEKTSILSNPALIRAFDDIDDVLKKNAELRGFRDYLIANDRIIIELENIAGFRQKLWISYLKSNEEIFLSLLDTYSKSKVAIDEIVRQAKLEATDWAKVVDTYNKRFFVPFRLMIKNQGDAILGVEAPTVTFVFKENDSGDEAPVEQKELIKILSGGEKRALYLLNIIFEVEARKKDGQKTLFIIDDIADSFDYQNKYAIIAYLKEMTENSQFFHIILTHNFDFFRTAKERLHISRDSRGSGDGHCLMVEKTKDETKLVKAEHFKPFEDYMNNLDQDKKFISSLAFVRNIIEYTKGLTDPWFLALTSVLHIKDSSESITKGDLEDIYKQTFPNLTINFTDKNKKVIELIFELADACLSTTNGINLENKIILSMAIRLKAEKYMIDKVTDKTPIEKNQTRILFDRFKQEFSGSEDEKIKILDRVNLMTPENIHLNSFMYEPILDMSDEHLKTLYTDVKNL